MEKERKKPYQVINELLEKKGMSRHILAQRTGIAYNTIKGYLGSAKRIPVYNLQKIAKALNVNTSYLLSETPVVLEDYEKKVLKKVFTKIFN